MVNNAKITWYIKFIIAYNTIVTVNVTKENVMAKTQQNSASKSASKTTKVSTTKGAAKSNTKNCSNCSNCK